MQSSQRSTESDFPGVRADGVCHIPAPERSSKDGKGRWDPRVKLGNLQVKSADVILSPPVLTEVSLPSQPAYTAG